MRILFVLVSLPFPANIGQRMRNYSLLRGLHMEGHEVTLLAFGDPEELTAARSGLVDICSDINVVQPPKGPGRAGYLGRLRALASDLPSGAWRLRSEAMQAAVADITVKQHFDLVICDDVYQFKNLPAPCPVPAVLNKHTIVHEEVRRFLENRKNPLVLAYGWTEYRRLLRLEKEACANVTAVWTCSERDRQILVGRDSLCLPRSCQT